MKRLSLALLFPVIAVWPVWAQQPVTVIGAVTPGDCVAFFSHTQLKDAGVVGCGGSGGLTVGAAITGTCPNGDVIYNNAGVVGCEVAPGSLVVGTSTITGGTNGAVLYNNAGVLGNLTSIAWGFISGTPTTLAGYGITNARILFTSQPNFYTNNSTGSDSNNCLAPTVSGGNGPCATITHTAAVSYSTYDSGGFLPQINVATGTGTYNEEIDILGPAVGFVGFNIIGTGSANVTIKAPAGKYAVNVQDFVGVQFTGFTFACTAGAAGEWNASKFVNIDAVSDVKFTACPGANALNGGFKVNFTFETAPDFSGNMASIVVLQELSSLSATGGCTISGNPTYSTAAFVAISSTIDFGAASCTGAFTGTKFELVSAYFAANGRSPNIVIAGGTNGTLILGAQDDASDNSTSPVPVGGVSCPSGITAGTVTVVNGVVTHC